MTVHCSDFEELTSFKEVGKKPGTFYAQSSGTPKLISPDSVGDTSVKNYTGWRIFPVRSPKILDPYPDQLFEDIKNIRVVCPYIWPSSVDSTVQRSRAINRKSSSLRSKKQVKEMGRKNLDALPDYSQRVRGKHPAVDPPKPSASEERELELAKKRSL
ncbi:hypothetical protein AtEden1_Chr5g0112421 [Arabidopsis thaliana]